MRFESIYKLPEANRYIVLMLLRNLLSTLGIKPIGTGSRSVKHLVCLIEHAGDGTSKVDERQVEAIREFKKKYGLSERQFMDLANVLGTDL